MLMTRETERAGEGEGVNEREAALLPQCEEIKRKEVYQKVSIVSEGINVRSVSRVEPRWRNITSRSDPNKHVGKDCRWGG